MYKNQYDLEVAAALLEEMKHQQKESTESPEMMVHNKRKKILQITKQDSTKKPKDLPQHPEEEQDSNDTE